MKYTFCVADSLRTATIPFNERRVDSQVVKYIEQENKTKESKIQSCVEFSCSMNNRVAILDESCSFFLLVRICVSIFYANIVFTPNVINRV